MHSHLLSNKVKLLQETPPPKTKPKPKQKNSSQVKITSPRITRLELVS